MATVTMLHSHRATSAIQNELSRTVAEAKVEMCVRLLRGVSSERTVGDKCAIIVSRLGMATLDAFDQSNISDEEVDEEFMSWFGLKLQQSSVGEFSGAEMGQLTPSIDIPWDDLLDQGFNTGIASYLGFFI